MTQVDQLKSEIADQYLKQYRQDLNWLKKLALLPIQEDVKKILTWKTALPDKFDEIKEFWWWKTIIPFFSKDVAEQIFNFMKEKRLEIENRKTEAELLQLKEEIITGISASQASFTGKDTVPSHEDPKDDQNIVSKESASVRQSNQTDQLSSDMESKKSDEKHEISAEAVGAATSVGGVGAVIATSKLSSSLEQQAMARKLTPEQIKWNLDSALETLKKKKEVLKSRMSKKQIASLDNHIKKLTDGLSSIDQETPELLKLWDSLGNKLPKKILVESGLDTKTLSKIEKLIDKLEGKSIYDIKQILKNNNITNVSDELVESFSKAASKAELWWMFRLLKHGSKLNRAIQTLSGMMLVDVACLGLDVWMYIETNKEAELIKKVNEIRGKNKENQAAWQLGIWVASVALELLLVCTVAGSAGWPVWTAIWFWIGAVSAAASMGVDSLYFDVKDFYLQNKEDFIRQKRSQLNQAILQGLYNQKKWNQSLNEKIWAPEFVQKSQSLQDAIWSILFLDELENGTMSGNSLLFKYIQSGEKKSDFVAKLSSREQQQFLWDWGKMEILIQQRIGYLKPHFQSHEVIQKLNTWGGIQYINALIDQSRIYQTLIAQNKRDKKSDFTTNLSNYKLQFFAEFPRKKLEKLENLRKINPELYHEMMITVDLNSLLKEDETNPSFSENVKLVQKMQERIRLTEWEEFFHFQIPDSHKNVRFMENFLYADFDLTNTPYPSISSDEVKEIVKMREERRWDLNISDLPMQNILYRLANELYGYSGANEQSELMRFYSESLGSVQWFYFSDKRKINEDWRKDFSLNTELPSSFPQSELNNRVDGFFNSEFWTRWVKQFFCLSLMWFGLWGLHLAFSWTWASTIDTPTESIDPALQKEFETKLRVIIKDELSYRTREYQEKIRNQISSFVSKNANNGTYVELPYYLLLQAKRAGLGDLQRQFFTREHNSLKTLSLKSELGDTKALCTTQSYLVPHREKFTDEEQSLIDRVENAHNQLEAIRWIESSFSREDELDLPKDIEILISDKYKEREKFKSDSLYYDAEALTSEVIQQYQDFATYFENLYFGILLSLTTFKLSNDIDSFALYNMALNYGEWDFFTENGALDPQKISELEFLKNPKVQEFYMSEIKKQKIWSQSIEQLRKSNNSEERQLACQASKIVFSTILSESLIGKDATWNLKRIKIGGNYGDTDSISALSDTNKLSSCIEKKLKVFRNISSLDRDKVKKLIKHDEVIKDLTVSQKKVIDWASPLQKQIEATEPDIVRQGKRWNIIYDPEKSTLKSRWKEIKLTENLGKYYLQWLNIALNIKDALRIANFANWAKKTYKGRKISFESEWLHDALVVKWEGTFSDDIEIISQDDLIKYCSLTKDDLIVEQLAAWLTRIIT